MTTDPIAPSSRRGARPPAVRERGGARLARWRARVAERMRALADAIAPAPVRARVAGFGLDQVIALAGATRLDSDLMGQGRLRMRYRATDAVWTDIGDDGRFVDLREHVRRLCLSIQEMAGTASRRDWNGVAHNLTTAYSMTDLFAETDVDGAGMWCSPIADFETANGEVTEKYLAAVVVFTFVWLAYEGAVEAMSTGTGGKGARGRDMMPKLAAGRLPCLRASLHMAVELDPGGTDFGRAEMRRMLKLGSIAGIAAEHLRQFRNRLIHGDLPKPGPRDRGEGFGYFADADPRLRRFHANTRLLLLLLQILAREAVDDGMEIRAWLGGNCGATLALTLLHYDDVEGCPYQPRLDLGDVEMPPPS